jgi:hypothetical protein
VLTASVLVAGAVLEVCARTPLLANVDDVALVRVTNNLDETGTVGGVG